MWMDQAKQPGSQHLTRTYIIQASNRDMGAEISRPTRLTSGAFVLMTGRLGSIYGHKNVLLAGAAWWIVWSFINAFCNHFVAFNVARALSGIGAAMIVPNAVAVIGTTLPPGKMRNLSLGFFGAGAPVGGWLGALFAGLLAELTPWKCLFIFMWVSFNRRHSISS